MDPETASLRTRLLRSAKRAQKSCGPCRARKVKCNRAAPCVRCVKSGYPDLCVYDERARHSTRSDSTTQPPNESSASARQRDLNQEEETPNFGLGTAGNPARGQHAAHVDKHPYLGANSLPQFLDNDDTASTSTEHDTRQRARDAMMPMLGLAPSALGYPFYIPSGNLEEHAIARLFRSLPSSRDIIR